MKLYDAIIDPAAAVADNLRFTVPPVAAAVTAGRGHPYGPAEAGKAKGKQKR